jgi:hypothetical protein
MEKAASLQHQLRFDNAVMPEKAAFFYPLLAFLAHFW